MSLKVSTEGLKEEKIRAVADINFIDGRLKGGFLHKPTIDEANELMVQRARATERLALIDAQLKESDGQEESLSEQLGERRGREEKMF